MMIWGLTIGFDLDTAGCSPPVHTRALAAPAGSLHAVVGMQLLVDCTARILVVRTQAAGPVARSRLDCIGLDCSPGLDCNPGRTVDSHMVRSTLCEDASGS